MSPRNARRRDALSRALRAPSPLAFALAATLCAPTRVWAQSEGRPPSPFTARPDARHALYAEGGSFFFVGGGGVSYAWRPIRAFAVSGGAGASYSSLPAQGGVGVLVGGQVMLHLLLPADTGGVWSAELAAGGALMVRLGDDGVVPVPSAFAGVRRQPLDGGILFRVGFTWVYGYGAGVGLSVGVGFR